MKREGKEVIVGKVTEFLGDNPDVFLADFSGINVEGVTLLRSRFRAAGIGDPHRREALANKLRQRASRKLRAQVLR